MNKFGFELTEFGWYNAVNKISVNALNEFDLKISITNGTEFDRVYSYIINPKIKSMFSLLSYDKVHFDKAFSYDQILLLWENQLLYVIGVGFKGDEIGYIIERTVQQPEVNVSLALKSSNQKAFRKDLKQYTKGYTKENQINVDLEYQGFFYQKQLKRKKEEEEFLFILSLRKVLFPCCGFEGINVE